jgi:hypothetical protein
MAKKATAAKAEETPAYVNPYKVGSRKAEIYDVFMENGGGEAGLKAAMKRADKLDIKPGTVKSWSGAWLKGVTKPAKKEKADKPAQGDAAVKGFNPWFKYTTREAADKRHENLCTQSGLRPHCFHVIEQDGRFAVVPATYKSPGPPPIFQRGDTVYDAFIANTQAKVLEPGPEQTVIRYVKDRPNKPREECVINRFLVKLPDEEAKARKRERL